MSLFQVYDRDPIRGAGFPDCSVNDACNSNCGGLVNRRTAQVNVPNPLEITVGDNRGNIALRMLCTWPIGPNASRFSCAISCIIMFICVFIWAYRTMYPQYSKIYHVIPFLAADAWWWAVMITDATEIIKSNASCQELQVRATITGAWAINCETSSILTYTVLCDGACALFFLILPISTFLYSNGDVPFTSSPEASAPPATPPSAKSKMEEVVVKKAVDVAIANPDATKKVAVALVSEI